MCGIVHCCQSIGLMLTLIRVEIERIQPIVATTTFKGADKAKNASYNELAARMERAEKLTEATEELQVQKNLMVCGPDGGQAGLVAGGVGQFCCGLCLSDTS
mgnify:CR=1 FL=1